MNKKLAPIFRILVIIFGSFLAAVAINELLVPHKLLSGGISGIALIIQYVTGFSAGALFLIMNIPVFIIGVKQIDRDFIIHSLIGMLSLSIMMIVLKDVKFLSSIRVDDTMLASIFGGVLSGIGGGIVFRNRGSMGGIDIIAVIVKKHRALNIGTASFLINVIIVGISSILYGSKLAMFTLVSMYLTSAVIDRVQEGFDRRKSVFVVSEREDEVAAAIMNSLHRGVTFLYGEGAYTKNNRRIIYCIVTAKQLARLKHIVQTTDPKAFLTVSDTAEVLGKGFKNTGI